MQREGKRRTPRLELRAGPWLCKVFEKQLKGGEEDGGREEAVLDRRKGGKRGRGIIYVRLNG